MERPEKAGVAKPQVGASMGMAARQTAAENAWNQKNHLMSATSIQL